MTATKSTKQLLDDCFLHDRNRLSHAEALDILRARLGPITGSHMVPLYNATGRIAASPVVAQSPVPAHTNAAVDGFAFKAPSNLISDELELIIATRATAGRPLSEPPQPGTATRIFTGAVMPDGFDTVVMQEDTQTINERDAHRVKIPAGLKRGANVRKAGEDVESGTTIFETGHIIRPQDVAAVASIGEGEISCFKPLRVGVVSTGDEIVKPGTRPLATGDVFDANAPMLHELANLTGADVTNLGIWPDDKTTINSRLQTAVDAHDVILTSGGASRGDEDHMLAVLRDLGTCHMWQLAIKPGRPLMFGQIGSTFIVGLPGNPVAVFVCFLMYVYPLLRRLGGANWPTPVRYNLPAAFEVAKRKIGRREFWRGSAIETNAGLVVDKFSRDGSGLISGLTASSGLIDIPEDIESVAKGAPVAFIPYSQFGIFDG